MHQNECREKIGISKSKYRFENTCLTSTGNEMDFLSENVYMYGKMIYW